MQFCSIIVTAQRLTPSQRLLSTDDHHAQELSFIGPTGEEMRAAVDEWQAKHSRPDMPLQLTTGFLDGTSPVVDIYELKVIYLALVHMKLT